MTRILAAILLAAIAWCQSRADVNPVVLSTDDGEPVAFACAINKSKTLAIMADVDGRFLIPQSALTKDSVIVTRIGYSRVAFAPKEIPDTIFLTPSPTELQGVTVHPLKRKTLGDVNKPNFVQQWMFDMKKKYAEKLMDIPEINKEIARRFKLKHDSQLLRVRICTLHNRLDSVTYVLNLYRKVEGEYVSVLNEPIYKSFNDDSEHFHVREFNIIELVEPQPAGEYLIGITFPSKFDEDGKKSSSVMFTVEPFSFAECYDRSLLDDSWHPFVNVVGMELDIAY